MLSLFVQMRHVLVVVLVLTILAAREGLVRGLEAQLLVMCDTRLPFFLNGGISSLNGSRRKKKISVSSGQWVRSCLVCFFFLRKKKLRPELRYVSALLVLVVEVGAVLEEQIDHLGGLACEQGGVAFLVLDVDVGVLFLDQVLGKLSAVV